MKFRLLWLHISTLCPVTQAAVTWVESGCWSVWKLTQQEWKAPSKTVSFSWLTEQVHFNDHADTKENSEKYIKKKGRGGEDWNVGSWTWAGLNPGEPHPKSSGKPVQSAWPGVSVKPWTSTSITHRVIEAQTAQVPPGAVCGVVYL